MYFTILKEDEVLFRVDQSFFQEIYEITCYSILIM